MESATQIDPELLAIYRASNYRVDDADPPFVMHIDVLCTPLKALMQRYGHTSALFISAWNPGSIQRSDGENAVAQAHLEARLCAEGFRMFHGVGEDPGGQCAGEPCLLVLGWPHHDAKTLAQEYGQNAVLWSGADGIPRLVVTR